MLGHFILNEVEKTILKKLMKIDLALIGAGPIGLEYVKVLRNLVII